MAIVAAALILLGAVGVVAGLWLGIESELGPAWASAISGLISLVLAAGALLIAERYTR